MKVEVEASAIAALEQRVEHLSQLLTVAMSKRKTKTLTVTDNDLAAVQGATVTIEHTETGVKLVYQPA